MGILLSHSTLVRGPTFKLDLLRGFKLGQGFTVELYKHPFKMHLMFWGFLIFENRESNLQPHMSCLII